VWQKDELQGGGLEPADGINTDSSYQAPGLTTTTDFYRIAKAGVCLDTSNVLRVQVWNTLENNLITDNDTVCFDTELPGLLESQNGPPVEGDPNDYRYQWITSPDASTWADVPGATSESYQPPVQTQDAYFSRIVLSGSENACVDTATFVEILNIRLIENNTISETQTVCTNDVAETLLGSDPTGGLDDLQFSYSWEARTKSGGWIPVTDTSFVKIDYDPGIMEGDTTWYRRVVGAGGVARNVCISFSDVDTIHVLPPITNNLITTVDSILCEEDLLEDLVQNTTGGSTPIGGDDSWIYQWQVATGADSPGDYSDVPGATAIDYLENPVLTGDEDRWYRRRVYSGPGDVCRDFSLPIHVNVHTGITNNTIDPADSVCFNTTKEVLGAAPGGEEGLTPEYIWRDAVSGADLPGPYGQNYSYTNFNVQQVYQFERETTIGACTDTSNTMLIAVMQLPGGALSSAVTEACARDEVLMIVDLNQEDLDTYITPWDIYLNDGVSSDEHGPYNVNENGEIEVSLDTISEASMQYNYTLSSIVYSSPDRFECKAPAEQLSGQVPIMVFHTPNPQITIDQASNDSVCGTTISLLVDPNRGVGVWTYEPASYISDSPTSGNGYVISIPDIVEAFGTYRATFTSTAGVCSGSESIDLSYFEEPEPASTEGNKVAYLTEQVQLNANTPTAGLGTWTWDTSTGIEVDDVHEPATWAYNLLWDEENIFTWTITNGTCESSSAITIVTRTDVKKYQGFSPNGDMNNEYFIMQGIGAADDFTITFFNSLGNTVRTVTKANVDELDVDYNLIMDLKEDELVVWDGRSENGTLVPSGTYYYAVVYEKEGLPLFKETNYVVVLRDD
jgi:hypothetical protein